MRNNIFQNLILYLVFRKNFRFLGLLISIAAETEINFKVYFDKNLHDLVEISDFKSQSRKTFAELAVPKDSKFCSSCCFKKVSRIAQFFYGKEKGTFCTYLNRGDFSYVRPTCVLWDNLKECDLNLPKDVIPLNSKQNV